MEELESYIEKVNNLTWDIVLQKLSIKRRRISSDYYALCHFHQEKRPSMRFSEQTQRFHCYGCGAGGTVFEFIAHIISVKCDNPRIYRFIKKKFGIGYPFRLNPGTEKVKKDEDREYYLADYAGVCEVLQEMQDDGAYSEVGMLNNYGKI